MPKPPPASASALGPPPAPALDRRAALKGLGALVAAACAPAGKGGAADSAGGDTGPPLPSGLSWELVRRRVDTVVVLCMENRSFDHVFGALSLVEGRAEVDGLAAEMSNPHPEGGEVAVFPTGIYCLSDPPHSWRSCHAQFNGGANDGFVREFYDRAPDFAPEAMGFWTREALPVSYALADAFVSFDRWFSPVMSSTWPNRFYLHCGQNGGVEGNSFPPEPFPSIYTPLAAAGFTWGTYYVNVPFLMVVPDRKPVEPQFQPIETFFLQAEAGSLPNVVVLDPAFGRNDDHPPAHPVAGQVFIAQIYEALRQSPQWERMVVLITYDEHGGFFDHVPPPTAPDARADAGFGQRGFRVPTLLIGRYVRQGAVDHVDRDHCSYLALLERLFDLDPLTERDAAADPMLELFDEAALRAGEPRPGPALPVIEADEDELYAPDCVGEGAFFSARSHVPTGQPELEAAADRLLVGSPHDRRAQTDDLYRWLLQRAQDQGLLRVKAGAPSAAGGL